MSWLNSQDIVSNATLALTSGEWLFRFTILDRPSRYAIQPKHWSKFSRPLLLQTFRTDLNGNVYVDF
jgi:hypothetical protein